MDLFAFIRSPDNALARWGVQAKADRAAQCCLCSSPCSSSPCPFFLFFHLFPFAVSSRIFRLPLLYSVQHGHDSTAAQKIYNRSTVPKNKVTSTVTATFVMWDHRGASQGDQRPPSVSRCFPEEGQKPPPTWTAVPQHHGQARPPDPPGTQGARQWRLSPPSDPVRPGGEAGW